MPKRGLIPTMFHRRLALLFCAAIIGATALCGQLVRLTVVKGDELRAAAESALVRERWTPTVRGRLLDRKGRVLALDRPSFDVAVDYDVISGVWAHRMAEREARRENAEAWGVLDAVGRERLIESHRGLYDTQLDAFWREFAQAAELPTDEIEQRKSDILRRVRRIAASVWSRAAERREDELAEQGQADAQVTMAEVARPIREHRQAHTLLRGVDDQTAFRFRRLAERMPGLRVIDGGEREYPLETVEVAIDRTTFPGPVRAQEPAIVRVSGVATHVVGWLRDRVYAEDMARRPAIDPETGELDRGHYQLGDRVGHAGAESAFERELRGLRGRTAVRLDTGERSEVEPERGRDVRLTIDAILQARLQAVMDPALGLARVQEWHAGSSELALGTPLNAAAVVLDIQTGEILAMASTPTFTREQAREEPEVVFADDPDAPWINKALEKPYPPGSVAKALILASAVTSGAHPLDQPIACTGHFLENRNDVFRCWIYKRYGTTHNDTLGHALPGDEALCVSCNIYFYTLGRKLGPERIRQWYEKFGVGSTFGLGLGPEAPGFLGNLDGGAITNSDAILMGIGQGPVAWTPLHAADAMATLARGGLRITPRVRMDTAGAATDLRLDPRSVDVALRGLDQSVNASNGTGHSITTAQGREDIFNVPGVRVWGKTGTATAPPVMIDPDGDGPRQPRKLETDHSWFVVLAAAEGDAPRYAIAVIAEHGGSGGRVSGPIANQAVWALAHEGYLPGAQASGSAQ